MKTRHYPKKAVEKFKRRMEMKESREQKDGVQK